MALPHESSSFDEVVLTMKLTGIDIEECYRETSRGGLASTWNLDETLAEMVWKGGACFVPCLGANGSAEIMLLPLCRSLPMLFVCNYQRLAQSVCLDVAGWPWVRIHRFACGPPAESAWSQCCFRAR
jgi:hypothetical protein